MPEMSTKNLLFSEFIAPTKKPSSVPEEARGRTFSGLQELQVVSSHEPPPSRQENDYNHDKVFSYAETLQSLKELTQSPPPGSIVCRSKDYTPIYDKIVPPSNNNTTETEDRKIPRILHFSFNDRCVPNDLAESIQQWQETLPDHSIFFHDDQALERLVGTEHDRNTQLWHTSEYFPKLRNNLRCVKFKGAMLIDIWRMLVVWTYGGMYTDIDNLPGPKFDAHTIRDGDSFFSLSDSKKRPSQWLFAMTRNHPIAIFTLQDISRRLLRIKNIARPRVVYITGPKTLESGFRKFKILLEQNATIFGKSSYFTQVQQIGSSETSQFAVGSLGETFDQWVGSFFDETANMTYTNITKRMKTELLSGVVHWTEQVKSKRANSIRKDRHQNETLTTNTTTGVDIFDGVSCKDYLATLDQ